MWIDPCQCLTARLSKEAGFPPGVQGAGGDRLGAGHAEKGGPGTAGPLGAGAPPGELPAGDAAMDAAWQCSGVGCEQSSGAWGALASPDGGGGRCEGSALSMA